MPRGDVRIGISGWTYAPWRGVFYPKDLTQKRELEYASRQFPTIEINGSFYSLQTPASYRKWRDATPDDFVFSIKGGRFITHMRRLLNAEKALANFFASGVLELGAKLGPILWQLPPTFQFDEDRCATFFDLLPRDAKQASQLAKQHDRKPKSKVSVEARVRIPIRHAIEVRHDTFKTRAFVKLCKRHDIAIVVADTAGKWPMIEERTSDFTYVRLHGDEVLYVSGYTDAALDSWASKVRAWRRRGDVYAYFDNDVKVCAPKDARTLIEKVR